MESFHPKQVLDKSRYYRRMSLMWLHLIVWIIIFIVLVNRTTKLGLWVQILLGFVLFVIAPDIKLLFQPYSKYMDWINKTKN